MLNAYVGELAKFEFAIVLKEFSMAGKKCADCNKRLGGLFGAENFGTEVAPLCKSCFGAREAANPKVRQVAKAKVVSAASPTGRVASGTRTLIIICSNGDGAAAPYKQAEQAFVRRFVAQKGALVPSGTQVRTFPKPNANLPDVNNPMTTQAFLSVLLNLMGVDPQRAMLSWKAERFNELGYTFVPFLCTADNSSYSFESQGSNQSANIRVRRAKYR
jgi:hypothetical protein